MVANVHYIDGLMKVVKEMHTAFLDSTEIADVESSRQEELEHVNVNCWTATEGRKRKNSFRVNSRKACKRGSTDVRGFLKSARKLEYTRCISFECI